MAQRDIARRIAVLETIVRPTGSLIARIENLTPSERNRYERWRAECHRWFASFKQPGDAFEAILESGVRPPELDHDVSRKMFDRALHVTLSDSVDDARRKYEEMAK